MLPQNLALAVLAALGIGLVTFIGPCAPTRLATADGNHTRALSYIVGAVLGFALLGGLGALLFNAIFIFSPVMYILIGVAAIVTGFRQVATEHDHAENSVADSPLLAGVAGFGSAFTLAPCCSTIIIATLTFSSNPFACSAILAAYGLGHSAPMIGLQALINRLGHVIESPLRLALGGVSLALGIYYIVLA